MKTQDVDVLLRTLVIQQASDLHLQVGASPVFRVHGELNFSDLDPLTEHDIEEYANAVLNEEQRAQLESQCRVDLSHAIEGIARFRINIYKQRGAYGLAMRIIPFEIPTLDGLELPPVLKDLAAKPHGLVLVTGPTGSGKSTTLAAIINHINQTRKCHIVTIEEPIEFVHENNQSLINQREVGADTPSFSMALRDALREDPDVILVGEMRDLDTISNAVTAAETGHLVFATLHTNDAVQAIDRIIGVFPPHQQSEIRSQLASSLQGVIAQVLLRDKEGKRRMAATEILVANSAIRNLIREAKSTQIYNVMQTGRQEGMHLLKDSLMKFYQEGKVSKEEVIAKIEDPKLIQQLFPGE